jgi:hypothetical protein
MALGWSGVVLAVADFGPRPHAALPGSKIQGNEQKEPA